VQTTTSTGRARAFDRERRAIFLEKADIALADADLASLASAPDAALGIDDACLARARAAFGIDPSARIVRAASQGTFHRLYEVHEPGREPRLLRIAAIAGEPAADRMAAECGVLAALRAEGLPVPACGFHAVATDGERRGAHLLERMAGVPLSAFDEDEARMAPALEQAARLLARVHRLQGAGFGPVSLESATAARSAASLRGVHEHWRSHVCVGLEAHVRACEAAGAISRVEAAEVVARFASAHEALRDAASALLHGDPGSHNFIVQGGAISGLVDWEDALLGDPLFDLASLTTFQPERRHAALWSAYGARMRAGGDEWQRFWLYFLRIALAKTVHRRRFGYADRAGRPPASRRIQLALERLQA